MFRYWSIPDIESSDIKCLDIEVSGEVNHSFTCSNIRKSGNQLNVFGLTWESIPGPHDREPSTRPLD